MTASVQGQEIGRDPLSRRGPHHRGVWMRGEKVRRKKRPGLTKIIHKWFYLVSQNMWFASTRLFFSKKKSMCKKSKLVDGSKPSCNQPLKNQICPVCGHRESVWFLDVRFSDICPRSGHFCQIFGLSRFGGFSSEIWTMICRDFLVGFSNNYSIKVFTHEWKRKNVESKKLCMLTIDV